MSCTKPDHYWIRGHLPEKPMSKKTDTGQYKIGAVSRITGIPPETLRMWERRYGIISPVRGTSGTRLYSDKHIKLEKGEQMGIFNMGSTVVLLFSKGTLSFSDTLYNHKSIKMGQLLGLNNNSTS